MLNTPSSSAIIWLKYPVFFIAALTVASSFARPKSTIAFTNPATEPISGVTVSAKKLVKPVPETKQLFDYKPTDLTVDRSTTNKAITVPIVSNTDSMEAEYNKLEGGQHNKNSLLPIT